jgi:hypothetical protein
MVGAKMTANELADALQETEPYYSTDYKLFDNAATMLRQQQAEIEALKKEAALQRLSDFTQEAESFDRTASHMAGEYVSYPVKALTDEEIVKVYEDMLGVASARSSAIDFAKAILRKAQE